MRRTAKPAIHRTKAVRSSNPRIAPGREAGGLSDAPLASEVFKEATRPIGVARFGAVGIVPSPNAATEQIDNRERIDLAVLIGGRPGRLQPVGALQEVDEVDAYRLLGLPDLPVGNPAALQLFAESPGPVGERPFCGGSREESPDPTHAVGRGVLLDESRLEKELSELLQHRFQLAHAALGGSLRAGRHRSRPISPQMNDFTSRSSVAAARQRPLVPFRCQLAATQSDGLALSQ